jgi:hypothetical protein
MNEVHWFLNHKDIVRNNTRDKILSDWITIEDRNETENNYIGLLKVKTTDIEKGFYIFYKSSKFTDKNYMHEYRIYKSIERLSLICPHFGRVYSLAEPASLSFLQDIISPSILSEYYNGKTLGYMIRNKTLTINQIWSVMLQVVSALSCARKYNNFSHNDLHPYNIQLVECDVDLVMIYSIDSIDDKNKDDKNKDDKNKDDKNKDDKDGECYYVPTLGYKAVIIDFAYSYSESSFHGSNSSRISNSQIFANLSHIKKGYNPTLFDPIADIRTFLMSISYILGKYYKELTIKMLRRKILKIFKNQTVNKNSGAFYGESIYPTIVKIIKAQRCRSITLSRLITESTDAFFSMVQPVEKDYSTKKPKQDNPKEEKYYEKNFINSAIRMLDDEMVKIETMATSSYTLISIINGLTASISKFRARYLQKEEFVVKKFRAHFLDFIDSKVKYFNVKLINYDKIIQAFIDISLYVEKVIEKGIYSTYLKNKQLIDNGVPTKMSQVFYILTSIMSPQYHLHENTTFSMVDMVGMRSITKKIQNKPYDEINESSFYNKAFTLRDSILETLVKTKIKAQKKKEKEQGIPKKIKTETRDVNDI